MSIQSKIQKLIENSLREKDGNSLFYDFATVSKQEAEKLKSLTDTDLTGYRHSLDRSGIIHALKHNNIDNSDILLIPYILKEYDQVKKGNKKNTIIYEKKIVDMYFYVEEVREGRKKLTIKTLYKKSTPV